MKGSRRIPTREPLSRSRARCYSMTLLRFDWIARTHMSILFKQSRWLRIAFLTAGLYLFLWAATLVFGPGAAQRAAQRRHVDYYTQRGGNPSSSQIELHSISVPAPFVVSAKWTSNELTANGKRSGAGTFGSTLTIWMVFWTQIVKYEQTGVFCGVAMPSP